MDIFRLKGKDNNSIALIEKNNVLLYGDLLKEVSSFAERIDNRKLVLIVAKNTIEAITAYLGTIYADAIPLLVNKSVGEERLSNLINLYKPTYLFLPNTGGIFSDKYIEVCQYVQYNLWEITQNEVEIYNINKDLALLLSTSGSTGSPKCVRLSYMNLKANTESIIKVLKIVPTDRAITTMPMDYAYGLSIINSHIAAGASLVISDDSIIYENFWNAVRNNKVNTFGGVPFTYETIIKLKLFDKIKGMRYLTQAGGKMQKQYIEIIASECKKRGVEFVIMYGQTEATARMSCLLWSDLLRKTESIGKAIPGGEFEVVNDFGLKIPNYQIGELVYKGKNVSMGYANDYSDLALGDARRGILYTGDIAWKDNEGFYYIKGRKNRFIKIYGNRIGLDEIEEKIGRLGYICACLDIDEKLIIIIELDYDNNEILNVLEEMGINKRHIKIVAVDKIPYTPSGKLDYNQLKEKFINE